MFSFSRITSMDLPDFGDGVKDLALEVGFSEGQANYLATGVCLASGDYVGAAEHGLDVAEDQGLLDGTVRVSHDRRFAAYPAPDDVEGWKQWIQEHGYEAFLEAYKAGAVDDSVIGDPGFMLVMQDEKSQYEANLEFRSNLMASEDRIRQLISRNMNP